MCYWYEPNQYLVSKQGRKNITRIVTWSKSATNALGLCKQDNTNDIYAADVEQISIPLANNVENEITKIMTCSNSQQIHRDHANNMTPMLYADDTGQITKYWKHMQWLVNTSLLKFICRGIWLCKITYPVICRLTLNKSDLHQTNAILNI